MVYEKMLTGLAASLNDWMQALHLKNENTSNQHISFDLNGANESNTMQSTFLDDYANIMFPLIV
jgi:hypothetical protein